MNAMAYSFEWPDGFLDVKRVEGRDKVEFDGFMTVTAGQEIPAYEFGVQTLYHLKVMAAQKDIYANAVVANRGQKGNSAIIYLYRILPNGTIAQIDEAEAYRYPTVVDFDGEGS